MARTIRRPRRGAHQTDTAAFFAVLAARHGLPTPEAPTTAQTDTQTDQDHAEAQDRLPGLEARP